ncbi:MAG: outer membrane lipoprotein carrier protein LolA [Alphaproteobacteria bacterium]|nr:outer membrane lipoprotein carrier protein LolA [Alphaproteobacteria bacterium]MBV9373863.1 outer membrane lipoprotein carrier protein LolA [Alphaproteobacteria bacterium]
MTGIGQARKRSELRAEFAALNRRAVLGASVSLALGQILPAAAATAPTAAVLTPQDNADLQRIVAYLSSIRTMYAKFQQVSGGGGRATGQLWMARPGRMRFEYDPPSPILLLADMFYVYYIDKELVQMSKVGLKSTPAWLLLRDPITFSDLIVTRFERGANTIRLTVVEKAEPDSGSLTMVFSDNPLALRQWSIVDPQHKTTTVSLFDERFGVALDPKLFVYQDPYAAARRQYQPN